MVKKELQELSQNNKMKIFNNSILQIQIVKFKIIFKNKIAKYLLKLVNLHFKNQKNKIKIKKRNQKINIVKV